MYLINGHLKRTGRLPERIVAKRGGGGFAPRRALMQSLLLPVFLPVLLAVFLPVLLADLTKLLKCLIPKALGNLAPCRPN